MKQQKKYLADGEQTEITDLIKSISKTFKEQGLDLILEILKWLRTNIKETKDKEKEFALFRRRTSEEIIKSKMATGCTDYALVFISLSRASGIPTKYIEAIRNKWIELGNKDFLEGHVFAECLINNKWYIIDPYEGDIKTNYRHFKIIKEGLDSWDLGIKNFDDLKKEFLEFKKTISDTKELK